MFVSYFVKKHNFPLIRLLINVVPWPCWPSDIPTVFIPYNRGSLKRNTFFSYTGGKTNILVVIQAFKAEILWRIYTCRH